MPRRKSVLTNFVGIVFVVLGCGSPDDPQQPVGGRTQQGSPPASESRVQELALEANRALFAGDHDRTIALWSEVIELEPEDPDWRRHRAGAYERRAREVDDPDEARRLLGLAVEDLTTAIDLAPSPFFYSLRADVHEDLDDFDAALADRNVAVTLREQDPQSEGLGIFQLLDKRASLHRKQENWGAAIADYDRIVDWDESGRADWNLSSVLDPQVVRHGALVSRARARASQGESEAAIDDYTRAIDLLDGLPDFTEDQKRLSRGGLLRSRGKLYDELGETEKATADEAASQAAFAND